jgi:hypothetical protein
MLLNKNEILSGNFNLSFSENGVKVQIGCGIGVRIHEDFLSATITLVKNYT